MKALRKDFVPVAGIVNGLLRKLRLARGRPAGEVEQVWRVVVGDALAEVSRVRAVSADAVQIDVVGAAARAELEAFYRERFLCALRDAGVTGVSKVRFHVADA